MRTSTNTILATAAFAAQPAPGQAFAGQPFAAQPFAAQPFGGQPFEGQPYAVTTAQLLAQEVAVATGAGLVVVCRAMLGIAPDS